MPELKPIYLDVSLLAPPEPMQAILSQLKNLKNNQFLKIKHSRKPIPLLAILDEQGVKWHYHSCTASRMKLKNSELNFDDINKTEHWLWVWLESCEFSPPIHRK